MYAMLRRLGITALVIGLLSLPTFSPLQAADAATSYGGPWVYEEHYSTGKRPNRPDHHSMGKQPYRPDHHSIGKQPYRPDHHSMGKQPYRPDHHSMGKQPYRPAPVAAEPRAAGWRILREGQTHWYTFQHPGGEAKVQIWMDAEPNEGVGFHVFSGEQVGLARTARNLHDVPALGRGTPNPYEHGHLYWHGTFAEAGLFYVIVEHGWRGNVSYNITSSTILRIAD
jgi:hypothetical protein